MDITAIPFSEIPADGIHVEGEIDPAIYELGPDDAHPTGPLSYSLFLLPSDKSLIVTGKVSSPFNLECVRCLARFPYVLSLSPFSADAELENDNTIHLTELLREDILLSLPTYPHCHQSIDGRECPVGETFSISSADDAPTDEEPPPDSPPLGAWDALGRWKPRSP